MLPEEAVQAGIDLKAQILLPVHWAKFALGFHPWDEPVWRVVKKAAELHVRLTTPRIGELVVLGEVYPDDHWWEELSASG
jgi:L-ascorbate metabolism protein UlaG (beta-lactamase superfamily)